MNTETIETTGTKPDTDNGAAVVSHGWVSVLAGQKYRNPSDGPSGPTITIVAIDGEDAVCVWRYADAVTNPLKAFAKRRDQIARDWVPVDSAEQAGLRRSRTIL